MAKAQELINEADGLATQLHALATKLKAVSPCAYMRAKLAAEIMERAAETITQDN